MKEIPKAKIYTRTGDQGKTRLVDGSCVEKFNPRVEAYGCIDELNSQLGIVRALCSSVSEIAILNSQLETIQNELFCLGSMVACADLDQLKSLPNIRLEFITRLEKEIDVMNHELPELRHFILPAGHIVAAETHIARTQCRRAERRSAEVISSIPEYALCMQYLNRLSDWLFVSARWTNLKTQSSETTWKKP